jgi:hypothetical protein
LSEKRFSRFEFEFFSNFKLGRGPPVGPLLACHVNVASQAALLQHHCPPTTPTRSSRRWPPYKPGSSTAPPLLFFSLARALSTAIVAVWSQTQRQPALPSCRQTVSRTRPRAPRAHHLPRAGQISGFTRVDSMCHPPFGENVSPATLSSIGSCLMHPLLIGCCRIIWSQSPATGTTSLMPTPSGARPRPQVWKMASLWSPPPHGGLVSVPHHRQRQDSWAAVAAAMTKARPG